MHTILQCTVNETTKMNWPQADHKQLMTTNWNMAIWSSWNRYRLEHHRWVKCDSTEFRIEYEKKTIFIDCRWSKPLGHSQVQAARVVRFHHLPHHSSPWNRPRPTKQSRLKTKWTSFLLKQMAVWSANVIPNYVATIRMGAVCIVHQLNHGTKSISKSIKLNICRSTRTYANWRLVLIAENLPLWRIWYEYSCAVHFILIWMCVWQSSSLFPL